MDLGIAALLILLGTAGIYVIGRMDPNQQLKAREQRWQARQEVTRRYLEARAQEFYQRQEESHPLRSP